MEPRTLAGTEARLHNGESAAERQVRSGNFMVHGGLKGQGVLGVNSAAATF